MKFSVKVKRVIALGDQIAASADAAARRSLAKETRALMAKLPAAEVYALMTLMYLGRGDFGIAGLLGSYVQISDTFVKPQRAIGQMLEKPFGQYLAKGVSRLEQAQVDLDSLLGSFLLRSPLASVDDGSAVELKIGPWCCDKCGRLIERAEDGMLQWLGGTADDRSIGRDLRIVHHLPASPLGPPNGCYPDQQELELDDSELVDGHLESYLGFSGLVDLLSKIEDGELPASDVNKVIMRLFVPDYEHARPYFDKAVSTGLVSPVRLPGYFFPEELKTIVANIDRLND
jgi:hypothetical protein